MTDITKLLDEHPLPWKVIENSVEIQHDASGRRITPYRAVLDTYSIIDDRGFVVRNRNSVPSKADAELMCDLANALHAERQKNTAPPSPSSTSTGVDPVAVGAPSNDSGDVGALRRRIGELERVRRMDHDLLAARIDSAFELIGDLERIVRDGERFEAIEKRLDAIANAARGSDE